MINLLILIPIHQREEVRKVAFDALVKQFVAPTHTGIHPYIARVETEAEGEMLGAKLNRGLADSKEVNWDYCMVLGSDDLLRPQTWGYVRTAIEDNIPAFGFNQAYLYDRINHRAKIWDAGPGTFGAGRCVRRDVVERTGWRMWDDTKNNGIDNSQERILLGVGEMIHIVQTHLPVVCDIKDGDNLNSFDDVPGLPVNAERVRELFPALEVWPLSRPMWTATTTGNV